MILKGTSNKTTFSLRKFPFLLLLIALLTLMGLKFYTPNSKESPSRKMETIFCSAEKKEGDAFLNHNHSFGNANLQSNEKAHSGDFSIKIEGDNKYGFTYILDHFTPGESYKVSAWSYSKFTTKGAIAVLGKRTKGDDFYSESGKNVYVDGNWWQKYELIFTIPTKNPISQLKIYVFSNNTKSGAIFFDDFKIEKLDAIDMAKMDFQHQKLHLYLDNKALSKLDEIRKQAFTDGVLIRSDHDFVKGKIIEQDNSLKVKVRYKGDWLDHLMGGNPSFRIQTKSGESWNRVQTFSVQHPKTRGYLREWYYHEFLRQMDILAPRYDFISFQLNSEKPKIMAFEEHFNKNLLESQLRREGPIIKFTEDRFWEGMKRSLRVNRSLANAHNKEQAYWSSEIKPFKEGKIRKSPNLSNQFEIAQNLLNNYKYGLQSPDEIFDLNRMAKFVAIVDLFRAYHSLTWHNQRFYYNPVTALLEPIGYDGHGDEKYREKSDHPIMAEQVYSKIPTTPEPINRLFYDKKFTEKYIKYLLKFTDLDFIEQYNSQFSEAIDMRLHYLQSQFKDYKFDKNELVERAKKISIMLHPFSNSLQIFKKRIAGDSVLLEVKNTHILPLEVVGVGSKSLKKSKPYSLVIYPQPIDELPSYVQITVIKSAKYIHFKLLGDDEIYTAPIPDWSSPTAVSPRIELLEKEQQKTTVPYVETNDVILFEKKTYSFNEPIIIPKDKKVIIEPGTIFNFKNGAFFLSYSTVEFRGDADEPIQINGLDNQSGAIVVLQVPTKSLVRNVIFNHQNTMKYKGWNLSGAVTFYESDVDVLNSRFTHNLCEDALNIVRSTFDVTNCAFDHVFSDAFDADYSKGITRNSSFNVIGNDAIDFSTSTIEVDQCSMKNIGDKGISAGEQATITANNIEVDGGNIGFASKDLSVLRLTNVSISNCKKGIVAYQKKPEYGPAKIILSHYSFKNVNYEFLIEAKSTLIKE